MGEAKIYSTVWHGVGYWITDLRMKHDDFERMRRDSGMDRWIYWYTGGRDAYGNAMSYLARQVCNVPCEQQAQLLEDYCKSLNTNPELCEGWYDKGMAQENQGVVYRLDQEIAALRERFNL